MMLASDRLRVVPATIHIPLADVPGRVDAGRAELAASGSRMPRCADRFGIPAPRIAVAGLNPHAGEGGKMGREEIAVIEPVLARLRAEGMEIAGPLSADTMFHAAARARYDAAIAMYHDQALIPIKTLDFDRGVNVTLGLPFIRSSPDHGTALDIAGRGPRQPRRTVEALRLAWRMAGGRRMNVARGGSAGRSAPGPPGVFRPHAEERHELDRRSAPAARGDRRAWAAAQARHWAEFPAGPEPDGADRARRGRSFGHGRAGGGARPRRLTRGLLAEGARHVLAIEKDARCLPALAEIAAARPGRLDGSAGRRAGGRSAGASDAADRDLRQPALQCGHGTAGALAHAPDWPPFWRSLTLMFQREVAERIVAQPGGKAYGRLACWRSGGRCTHRADAAAGGVHATAQGIFRRGAARPLCPRRDTRPIRRCSSGSWAAFNQRRKMLRAALKGLGGDVEDPSAAGIAPTDRAEQVPLEAFCALARSPGG